MRGRKKGKDYYSYRSYSKGVEEKRKILPNALFFQGTFHGTATLTQES